MGRKVTGLRKSMMAGLPRLKFIKGVLTCFSKRLFVYANVGINSVIILISVYDVERKEILEINNIAHLLYRDGLFLCVEKSG